MSPRESPLASEHAQLGAIMTEFGGWRLPVEYSSVAEEAYATRHGAGLFDVSHMGNLHLLGTGAAAATRRLLTRDIAAVPARCGGYALLCNEKGGIIDDLIFMVTSESAIGLVINASHHDSDVAWLNRHLALNAEVEIEDLRGRSFGIALQGPRAEEILRSTNIQGRFPDPFGTFTQMRIAMVNVLVSRTGYTGEDGFELFGAAADGPVVWRTILSFGRDFGLLPCGLAARDVLRQEMGYPLAGQDITEDTTPLEAGLRWAIDWTGEFIGREALESAQVTRRRVGFVMEERRIARHGAAIMRGDEQVGTVTSGTYSHNLGAAIGQGYILVSSQLAVGDEVAVEVRDRRMKAKIAKLPLTPKKTRPSWNQPERRAK
jgi:aminomethyltransferase